MTDFGKEDIFADTGVIKIGGTEVFAEISAKFGVDVDAVLKE